MSGLHLKVGAGAAEIAFPAEFFPTECFCGVHDAPHIRVLLFDQKIRFALVVAELINIPPEGLVLCKREISRIVRTTKENVWVHITHAISTPHDPLDSMPPFIPVDHDAPKKHEWFFNSIKNAACEAATKALESLCPAKVSIGKTLCDVNINRDVETPFGWWIGEGGTGPSNRQLTTLNFTAVDGNPIAVLVSYGIKPCALDRAGIMTGTRLVSADVPGKACRILEDKLGVPVIFCMSAAGDQVPREQALKEWVDSEGNIQRADLGVECGLEIVNRLGTEMAQDVEKALLVEQVVSTEPYMATAASEFSWPCKRRTQMRPMLVSNYLVERMGTVSLQVFRMGDIAFVTSMSEINYETERQLYELSPCPCTILLSMTNGLFRYMPEQSAYERFTWEAQSSALMPGAAERFVDEACKLISDIGNGRK